MRTPICVSLFVLIFRVMIKNLINYLEKRKLRKLFLRIYFTHLNHPLQKPEDAYSQSASEYYDIVKTFYTSSIKDVNQKEDLRAH